MGALAESGLPVGRLRAFGSAQRTSRVDHVQYGGEEVPVQPLSSLADDDSALLFLCVPPPVAEKLGRALAGRAGRVVVDVGDWAGLEGPVLLGRSDAALDEGFDPSGGVRIPSGPAWLVATLALPLLPRGLSGVSGTVLQGAGARGRSAVGELGDQVIASFNQQDPPRRIFPTGLAFDVLPEDGPGDEWSVAESRIASTLAAATGFAAERVAVQVATIPVFAGLSAGLHLRGVTVEDVHEALRGDAGLREVDRVEKLRPRAWTGRTTVGWGRVRADPAGDGVHLWAVADPVAGVAAAAVAAARALHARGFLAASRSREEES